MPGTIANPYTTVLGAPEEGPTRINIAQTVNGAGWILGPIVGGYFVFSRGEGVSANASLSAPYISIGIFVTLLLMIFAIARVPDLHAEVEILRPVSEGKQLTPSGAQLGAISVVLAVVCGTLYFFIAPILGLMWSLFGINELLFSR